MSWTTIVSAALCALLSSALMAMLVRKQAQKAPRVVALLREAGPLSLDEIARRLGTGVIMKGYLMQALDQMVSAGALQKLPPPEGTPALKKLRATRYAVTP